MESKCKYEKNELKAKIQEFLNNKKKLQIDVMFVKKTSSSKAEKKFKTYMFPCRKEDILGIVESTLKNILTIIDKREIGEYDLEISFDEMIQVVDKKDVINSKYILDKITVDLNDKNTISENIIFSRLDFLVIKLFMPDNKEIYLCKKHIKNASGYRKKAKNFAFIGKEYKLLGENILSIGSGIDACMIDGYYYVFQRNNFNSMFEYKDVFYKIINENREQINQLGVINKSNEFLQSCECNGKHLPRLTKAILAQGFQNLNENKENIKKTINDFGLKVKVNEDNTIVYNGPNDDSEILNLLLEHYVKSALSDKKMIAAAIEKYQV